jgi:hypothetical protein
MRSKGVEMTDHANTYPDLASVEDWLSAKGYTGEAGACHAAMSLIRKQEARIAELEAELKFEADHWLTLRTVYSARIAELEAALRPFADAACSEKNMGLCLGADIDHWPVDSGEITLGHLRAARAVLEKKDDLPD